MMRPTRRVIKGRAIEADSVRRINVSANLDVLRAVAALSVLCAHTYLINPIAAGDGLSNLVLDNLGDGVFLFFGISGYLITGPYVRALVNGQPLPNTRAYLLRRCARIYPAWWIAIAAMVLVAPQPRSTAAPILSHVFLVHGFVPGHSYAVLSPGWTLTIEMMFYLSVPACAWAVRRLFGPRIGNAALLACVGGGAAFSLCFSVVRDLILPDRLGGTNTAFADPGWVGAVANTVALSLPSTFVFFAPGIALAILQAAGTRDSAQTASRALVALVAGGTCWVLTWGIWPGAHEVYPVHEPRWALKWLLGASLLAVGTGLILVSAQGWTLRSSLMRVLAWVGFVSYGVYLWHWVVLSALARHGVALATLPAFVLGVALTVPIAATSHRYVEAPIMRWARGSTPTAGETIGSSDTDGHAAPRIDGAVADAGTRLGSRSSQLA